MKRICYRQFDTFGLVPTLTRRGLDRTLVDWIGHTNYLLTYRGRTGLFHLFKYLKEKHGIGKVWIPSDIHNVVKPAVLMNDLEIIETIDDTDVLLWTDYSKPNSNAIIIQDSAWTFQKPQEWADFVMYSLGAGKKWSASEGGIIVVNKMKFNDFLNITLKQPSIFVETKRLLLYTKHNLIQAGKRIIPAPIFNIMRGIYQSGERQILPKLNVMDGIDLSMCRMSKSIGNRKLRKLIQD